MSFMEQEVYEGEAYEVSANHGETWVVPLEASGKVRFYGDLSDYVEGRIDEPLGLAVPVRGWLARMTAPGYLDSTDWSLHETEDEATAYLAELYGDEDEDEA